MARDERYESRPGSLDLGRLGLGEAGPRQSFCFILREQPMSTYNRLPAASRPMMI